MKYFFFIIGMLLVMIPSAHAQLTDDEIVLDFSKNSNELLIIPDLYNIHNTIVCGTVIGKDPDKITPMPETSSYMEGSSYSIKVEKYFKNSSLNATIDALGSEDSNGPKQMLPFEIGQIVLFYIDKIDEKIHVISPDSIKVKTCKSIHLVSPLKQFKSGIPTDKITCKENLQLIIKNNENPACVKPETVSKLMQRGWALPELKSEFNSKDNLTSSIPLRGLPVMDNAEMQFMIDLFENKYATAQRTFVDPYVILNATNVWDETVSLVMQSMDGKVNATLTCNHMDWRAQEVITENVLDYLQNKNCFNPSLEETGK